MPSELHLGCPSKVSNLHIVSLYGCGKDNNYENCGGHDSVHCYYIFIDLLVGDMDIINIIIIIICLKIEVKL